MDSRDLSATSSAGRLFADRHEAGAELASHLGKYHGRSDVVVLALPRGGVPVAFEVAEALNAPLDVFIVRKLGMPGHPEFAMGAIASGGVCVLSDYVVRTFNISESAIEAVTRSELAELQRREREYRQDRPLTELRGRAVILVDDGLATGSTMRAAVKAVRAHDPARVVVAVPVGAPDTCARFGEIADDTICARMPERFSAIGLWYADFSQTTDDEVRELFQRRARSTMAGGTRA